MNQFGTRSRYGPAGGLVLTAVRQVVPTLPEQLERRELRQLNEQRSETQSNAKQGCEARSHGRHEHDTKAKPPAGRQETPGRALIVQRSQIKRPRLSSVTIVNPHWVRFKEPTTSGAFLARSLRKSTPTRAGA